MSKEALMLNVLNTNHLKEIDIMKPTIKTYYPTTKDCIGNIYEFSSSLLEDGAVMKAEHKDSHGRSYQVIYAPCICNGKSSWFNVGAFHSSWRLENLRRKPAKLGVISEQHYDNMLITLLVLAGKKLKVVDMKKVYRPLFRRGHRRTIYAPIFKML